MIKIKAVILCAGYATRLYPLTLNTPKSLLEVGNKAILGHLLDKIEKVKEIKEVFIISNHRFFEQFRVWLNHYESKKKIKLLNDGTLSNEDRLGAIGDLNFVLKEEDIKDDLLVIAGDNLFVFSLEEFVEFYKKNKTSQVAFCDLKNKELVKRKFGVGILEKNCVVNFEEKPWEPKSSLAATACYLFKKEDLSLIGSLISQGQIDAPGHLIKWLVENSKVNGFVSEKSWYDIGSHESLKEAQEDYSKIKENNQR
ncbi:nucleotidyltransferase family protein [Candidatus Woesearchaeota archaeon]|nr:nucleotidyltransferase family protein [Candidatus Woesearchaeota archaeon]